MPLTFYFICDILLTESELIPLWMVCVDFSMLRSLSFFTLILSFFIRLCDMTNYRHIGLIEAPPLLTFSVVFFLIAENLALNIVFILAIRIWTLIQRIIRMLFFRMRGDAKGKILSVLFTKYVMRMP